jgi:hypothetical protein
MNANFQDKKIEKELKEDKANSICCREILIWLFLRLSA